MVVITLLSDFGLRDPYVAEMKAVIFSLCPRANIVDISHEIGRHNIAMGSYILETAASYFPKGTIHVAVVDPGVGSSRLPVVVVSERAILIGPDNGLLARTSEKLRYKVAYCIRSRRFIAERASSTFQGRDIFAWTGGKVAAGHKPEEVGPRMGRLVSLDVPTVHLSKQGVACNVLHIDVFGNVILNVTEENLRQLNANWNQRVKIRVKGRDHEGKFVRTYSDAARGLFAILWGSQGYLEVALRTDNAAERLEVEARDPIELHFK